MVKDEISIIVKNLKLSMASSKIGLNVIKGFFILTINNKHFKNMLIL